MKPIILFGGTFDPIHNAHLKIANQLYDLFQSPITFVPISRPNYKESPKALAKDRLNMLKLAIGNNPNFILDTTEVELNNYLTTFESLSNLRNKVGFDVPVFFLIGSDSLISLDTWDNWQQLFNLTNFIVAKREGYLTKNMSSELKREFDKRLVAKPKELNQPYGQIYLLELQPQNISSTLIRSHVATNQTLNELVPKAISDYISKNQLYKST